VSQPVLPPVAAIDQPSDVIVGPPVDSRPGVAQPADQITSTLPLPAVLSSPSTASALPARSGPAAQPIAAIGEAVPGAPHPLQPSSPAMLPMVPSGVELLPQHGVTVAQAERAGPQRMPWDTWGPAPTVDVPVYHADRAAAVPSAPSAAALWPAAGRGPPRSLLDAAGRRLPPGAPGPRGPTSDLGTGMGASSLTRSGPSDHPHGALAESLVRLTLRGRLVLPSTARIPAGYVPDVPVPPGWVQSS
jgi:hypothetical protein